MITISGRGCEIASWKLLLVPMVGCHFFSSSRKRGPLTDFLAVILVRDMIKLLESLTMRTLIMTLI